MLNRLQVETQRLHSWRNWLNRLQVETLWPSSRVAPLARQPMLNRLQIETMLELWIVETECQARQPMLNRLQIETSSPSSAQATIHARSATVTSRLDVSSDTHTQSVSD
jgi:hypothetical protein